MNTLIIKPSSLGDIIQGLRVAQSLRDQHPDAVISWVVRDRFAEIVQRCPAVNGEVILFERHRGLRGLLKVCRQLRQRRYDAVLDFQGLLRSGLMTWAAKAPIKLGHQLCREGSSLFYDRCVRLPADGKDSHIVEVLLQFLPTLGLEPAIRSPISLQCNPPYDVDSRLRDCRPVVMIPNSREPTREWKQFPELTAALLRQHADVRVVWDSHKAWATPDGLPEERFINLTTKTGLLQMVGLLSMARLVIANDSGPTHIAAAMGIPTLCLHGPTKPEHTGPFPLESQTNNVLRAPNGDLSLLTVEEVMKAVSSILQDDATTASAA